MDVYASNVVSMVSSSLTSTDDRFPARDRGVHDVRRFGYGYCSANDALSVPVTVGCRTCFNHSYVCRFVKKNHGWGCIFCVNEWRESSNDREATKILRIEEHWYVTDRKISCFTFLFHQTT